MREEASLRTLLALIKLGAHRGIISVSTSELGEILGLSQQAASLRLLQLENEGMIERRRARRRVGVKLTEMGYNSITSLYSELKNTMEGKQELVFRGRLFAGLGEGGYYIGLGGYRKQFVKQLGFEPFPGTLNLKLASPLEVDQKRRLRSMAGLPIQGFRDKARTYGPAMCFRATINGLHQGAALVIERTHYDDTVLEVISPINLRRELKMKDGDEVSVVVHPNI